MNQVPPRGVQIHHNREFGRITRPIKHLRPVLTMTILTTKPRNRNRRIQFPSRGIFHRNHRIISHNELAPHLLESRSESLIGPGGVRAEVRGEVGAVVRGCYRVLVFPGLTRSLGIGAGKGVVFLAEGVGEPLRGTREGRFGVDVEYRLLEACCHLGLVDGRGTASADGVVAGAVIGGSAVGGLVDFVEERDVG